MIRDSAEIECVIREYRKNPAVIGQFYIGYEMGFSLSVVRDLGFPPTKFHEFRDLRDLTGWEKRWTNQILAVLLNH